MNALVDVLARVWQSRLRTALIVLIALLVLTASYWVVWKVGESRGVERARTEDQARAQAALAAAEAKYRQQEVEHEKKVEALRVKFVAEQAVEAATDRQVANDLASGARRVRLTVTRCRPDSAAASSTAARAADSQTAELPGATSAALYAIAADGDQAIRQLSALQAWARTAVELCSGRKKP